MIRYMTYFTVFLLISFKMNDDYKKKTFFKSLI